MVDHLGADEADVRDIGASVRGTLDHGLRHGRRGQPHVAADGDHTGLEVLDVRAADAVCALLVEPDG